MRTQQPSAARPGDRIVLRFGALSSRPGSALSGEVVEVQTVGRRARWRVRWDDGHESLFFPSADAVVEPSSTGRRFDDPGRQSGREDGRER